MSSCSSYETQKQPPNAVVVDKRASIEQKVVVIPSRVLDACKSLDVPVSGAKGGIVDTMLKNHETHGRCMFKNDLKTDFIEAAADTKATFEIYHGNGFAADEPAKK